MKELILFLLGILGTVLGFFMVNTFILQITFGQYILVEIILSLLHWMYNKAKKDLINKPI